MQIMIDIPNRIYKIIQNKTLNIMDAEILEKAVKSGKIIPKGHGRLIDADVLKETFIEPDIYLKGNEKGFWCFTSKEIKNAPTIIEAESEVMWNDERKSNQKT